MAEREIKRNGRGQIVSYEIYGALDSNIQSDSYGKSVFNTNGEIGTKVSKFKQSSYDDNVTTSISDELRRPQNSVQPNVVLGQIAQNFIVDTQGNDGQGLNSQGNN